MYPSVLLFFLILTYSNSVHSWRLVNLLTDPESIQPMSETPKAGNSHRPHFEVELDREKSKIRFHYGNYGPCIGNFSSSSKEDQSDRQKTIQAFAECPYLWGKDYTTVYIEGKLSQGRWKFSLYDFNFSDITPHFQFTQPE